jgi:hypothetical protein
MTDTRHLDTAISILKGTEGSKRAKRKAQVEIIVEAYGERYTIQMNGKVLEEGEGSVGYAKERAEDRANRIRALGKTVVVTAY